MKRVLTSIPIITLTILGLGQVHADSVAQIQTAKRITDATVDIIDPQGGTSGGGAGSNVNYAVGDILTFRIRFTPVENGATRGLGGYITEYVPGNTEVVGARIVDPDGNTVCPHRGGLAAVGWGPRGAHNFNSANFPMCPDPGCYGGEGGMSSLYADTGIFYSTDSRTARVPNTDFISVFNGLSMSCNPTGGGQLDDLLGANAGGPWFAHNEWDNIQLLGFGCNGSSITTNGTGNTPFGYGSAVAGPDTFYPYEATETAPGVVEAAGVVGPWQRIRTPCAEIGTGVPATERGPIVDRVGTGTTTGVDLSTSNPLPAGTNAVRFAVGELVVGQEYLAEISLRVLAAPLDPVMNADVNCSEVFGGDASSRTRDASAGGKDNTWRYFLPAPACVSLDLLFNLDVDKLQALDGETITYSIKAKNLDSVNTHTNVVITDDLLAGVGNVNFVSATGGGVFAGGVVTWPAITLAPGDEIEHTVIVTGNGANAPVINRATYTSDLLVSPGFSVVALTNLGQLAVIDLTLDAAPAMNTAGGTVTYTATIVNTGTGVAQVGCADCGVTVGLPVDFSVISGSVTVNGVPAGDPGGTAPAYLFTNGLTNIPAGGTLVLQFNALIDAATAPGVYGADLDTWLDDPAQREISDAIANVAPVLVDVLASDVPVVDEPIVEGATMVCGSSTEPDGSIINVYVDLLVVGTTTVVGGSFCTTVPSLFAGQNVNATAQDAMAGEIESTFSATVIVVGAGSIAACNDGMDNDSDGQIDWPDDPGCDSALDADETDPTACSDGVDNDGDGDIDFPADTSCSSYADDDESGLPACMDGVDNDGDGDIDFPADTDCESDTDVSEAHVPQCANGVDDDMDGTIDYPGDAGCASATDEDESDDPAAPDAGPGGVDAGMGIDAGPGGADAGLVDPPDPGGVAAPNLGCCATTDGRRRSPAEFMGGMFLILGVLIMMRRRARSRVK